jgi:hypothetical protein
MPYAYKTHQHPPPSITPTNLHPSVLLPSQNLMFTVQNPILRLILQQILNQQRRLILLHRLRRRRCLGAEMRVVNLSRNTASINPLS